MPWRNNKYCNLLTIGDLQVLKSSSILKVATFFLTGDLTLPKDYKEQSRDPLSLQRLRFLGSNVSLDAFAVLLQPSHSLKTL